jgi:beta-lactamase class A
MMPCRIKPCVITRPDTVITDSSQKYFSEYPSEYPLLSRRIFAKDQNDIIINFIPLREALKEYVGERGGKVGVYFEYLPSGISIGVNEKQEIKVVSLSKVPLVMSIFKKIERGKISLDDMLVIEEKHLDRGFGTLWQRGAGARVPIKELVRLALTESDNTAYRALFDQLTNQEVHEVYVGLDVSIERQQEGGLFYPIISPKSYSSIFRSLYLSSFLTKNHSNYILETLTQSASKDKLAAGVPDTVKIAHKIGVFKKLDSPSQNLFVDCGIVYVPDRPYILCASVSDTDEEAKRHLSYISKMIYEYIVAVKGEY